MKIVKRVAILLIAYVLIVVAFESMIGILQPQNQATLVITTSDLNGNMTERVVSRLESQGQLYVAANHWPRAWYNQALLEPRVQVDLGGSKANYTAIPVGESEHDRVNRENDLGLGFRILTGFPPRNFLRLDPI